MLAGRSEQGAAAISSAGFVTQPPSDELPSASQSTLLLQKKKEMGEVQQQLDRKKEEFRQRMQRCQEKEVDLAAKQEHIKEQVRKFDKFLKDNDAKRVRASRKAAEEEKQQEQKELEKTELMKQLEKQLLKKQELRGELARKEVYQTFLDNVCDTTDSFEGIETITTRYETLEAANHDLKARVENAQRESEDQNARLSAFLKKTQNDLLVCNSEIANQQKELDMLRLGSQDKEATLFRHEAESKDRTRQLGEIKMAIQNIYIRTRQRGAYPESNKQFLDAIQQRIIDYQAIVTGHDRPLAQFAVLKQPPPQKAAHTPGTHEDPAAAPRGSMLRSLEGGGGTLGKVSVGPGVGHGTTPSAHATGASTCRAAKTNFEGSTGAVSGAGHSMASDGQARAP
ncbi:MAG: hypothetical protein SGPRY_008843, partial [Prymnesium sp.]